MASALSASNSSADYSTNIAHGFATARRPVLAETRLSQEVWDSMPLSPVVAYQRIRLVPVFVAIPAALAEPWYVRNLLLYRNLSGLPMSYGRISPREVLAALIHVDWSRTLLYMLRATMWTGNNSFTSFDTAALNRGR